MRTVAADRTVVLEPGSAAALWSDVARWATFVDGFGVLVQRRDDWPAKGGTVVWSSVPGGRGTVTEKVVESSTRAFATRVFEERLTGTQRAVFTPNPGGEGAHVELSLEYEVTSQAPLRVLLDLFFVRRAVGESLRRTLHRFAIEAEDEAGLREPAAPESESGPLR